MGGGCTFAESNSGGDGDGSGWLFDQYSTLHLDVRTDGSHKKEDNSLSFKCKQASEENE